MKEIIQSYKDVVVQIHTPNGSGSGFVVKDSDVIVTNRHVVNGSNTVVIRGENFKKTVTDVIYSDALNDIAFLRVPSNFESRSIVISDEKIVAGERIIAIGHPLGLRFTATQGIVSKADRKFNNVEYIQVDAAINPGNSGGPLINEKGEIVGVNTFIYRDGESLGFALPATELNEILRDFSKINSRNEKSAKCVSCSNIVLKSKLDAGYCPNCGTKFDIKEFEASEYVAEGTALKIENILKEINVDVTLSRISKVAWDIEEGTAMIKMSYNTVDRFIYIDAILGSMPKDNIGKFYEYLLKENYVLENCSFSIWQQNIILGTIIHEQDLNVETAKIILKNIFTKANYYDDYLETNFGMEKDLHETA